MAATDPPLVAFMTWPQAGELWPEPWSVWLDTEYPVGRGSHSSGWQCPGCGACFSPTVAACFNCRGSRVTTATGVNEPEPVGVSKRLSPGDEITDDDAER